MINKCVLLKKNIHILETEKDILEIPTGLNFRGPGGVYWKKFRENRQN